MVLNSLLGGLERVMILSDRETHGVYRLTITKALLAVTFRRLRRRTALQIGWHGCWVGKIRSFWENAVLLTFSWPKNWGLLTRLDWLWRFLARQSRLGSDRRLHWFLFRVAFFRATFRSLFSWFWHNWSGSPCWKRSCLGLGILTKFELRYWWAIHKLDGSLFTIASRFRFIRWVLYLRFWFLLENFFEASVERIIQRKPLQFERIAYSGGTRFWRRKSVKV